MTTTTAHVVSSKRSGQNLLLGAVIAGSILLLGYVVLFYDGRSEAPTAAIKSRLTLSQIPFNGERAYQYLQSLCALGPRPSGSAAMSEQQKHLTDHFEKLGANVRRQEFRVRHPHTGEPVSMANLIVEWHPERRERILLCALRYAPLSRPRSPQSARHVRRCQRRGQRHGNLDGAGTPNGGVARRPGRRFRSF